MEIINWALTSFLLFLTLSEVHSSNVEKLPNFFLGRSKEGLRKLFNRDELQLASKRVQLETLWFDQKIDHFNVTDTRTFKQRYFYNSKYYKPNGPAILMIGGEGVEDGSWASITSLAYMRWAEDYGAAIFDLEHRFYGRSRPFDNQTTENLKYLSSRQAIEDIAEFIKAMNVMYNYTNPRWIAYGGSYSGALALWFREKHPELTVGAVGSSAPMLAKLDFHEYLEDVEEALTSWWSSCRNELADAMQNITSMIWSKEGRDKLQQIFNIIPPLEDHLDPKELHNFLSLTYSEFMGAVQYNRQGSGGVTELCDIMTNETIESAVSRVAQVYFQSVGGDSLINDYYDQIKLLQNPTYDDENLAATRSWIWQTCTEFGYYQTTDYGGGIFGSTYPLNFCVDLCKDVFGNQFDVETIQENVHSSNRYYGGIRNYKATNALLLYGSIDPWHKLGLHYQTEPSVVTLHINGTSHCADMQAPKPSDPAELKAARQFAHDTVGKWLNSSTGNELKNDMRAAKLKRSQLKPFVSTTKEIKLNEVEWKKKLAIRSRSRAIQNAHFMVMGRPYHGLVPDPPELEANSATFAASALRLGKILQPIDQFNTRNKDTFEQRYWINEQFYQSGGPQFLFLEGESTARETWLLNNCTFMRAVKKYNAMAFMLEHRFYGESRPYNSMSSKVLKYLTTKQALADIARFIKTMNDQYKFVNPRWVTFGGSYPGSLSAWFRQDYPELSVGAVASSAGTDIKVDFFEYLINTERSIRHYDNTCGDNIKTAFTKMNRMSLYGEGRANLSNIFNMKPPWTAQTPVKTVDVQFFFQDVYDKFQGAVQYNNDNTNVYKNGGGIKDTCAIMNNQSFGDEVYRVAEFYKFTVNFHGGNFTSLSNSYQSYVNFVATDDYSDEEATNARGWMYSCCTEIGYLQTTDIGDNAFLSVCPVDFWLNFCEDVFGKKYVPARNIYETVESAQNYYGGSDGYMATNIVFVSGKIDPWHSMGLPKKRETDTMKVFLLEETAHCADMYPPRPEDPQELTDVRERIFENIAQWITEDYTTLSTSLPTTTTTAPSTTITQTTPSTTITQTTTTTKTDTSSDSNASAEKTTSPSSTIPQSTTSTGSSFKIAQISLLFAYSLYAAILI